MSSFRDYLGEIPRDLLGILRTVNSSFFENIDCVNQLDELIEKSERWEVAIALLNAYDLIEICSLPSMVPSQKSEWCWHHYNRYFSRLSEIIIKIASNPQLKTELHYAIEKYHYEEERRMPVIQKGGAKLHLKTRRQLKNDLKSLGLDEYSHQL